MRLVCVNNEFKVGRTPLQKSRCGGDGGQVPVYAIVAVGYCAQATRRLNMHGKRLGASFSLVERNKGRSKCDRVYRMSYFRSQAWESRLLQEILIRIIRKTL